MRKLTLDCQDGQVHYALARLAITEAGLTKGFGKSQGFTRAVILDDDGVTGEGGDYSIEKVSSSLTCCRTENAAGCQMLFWFTWPEFKMVAWQLASCSCGDRDRVEYDL